MTGEQGQITEIDLEKVWQEKADKLARLFSRRLNMTPSMYISTLPRFGEKPAEGLGFKVPLIVETRIPWQEQASRAGITIGPTLGVEFEKTKLDYDQKKFRTSQNPYTTWAQGDETGPINRKRKPIDSRSELTSNQRGGTLLDGVAYAICTDMPLTDVFFDLIGSQVGSDRVPYLSSHSGRNGWWELHERPLDDVNPLPHPFQPLICTREIATLE